MRESAVEVIHHSDRGESCGGSADQVEDCEYHQVADHHAATNDRSSNVAPAALAPMPNLVAVL